MNTSFQTLLPLFMPANEGPWIDLGDHRGRPLFSSQHTAGAFLLVETKVDFLGGVPPHIHTREEEAFYVLEGRIEITVGDQTRCLKPGDSAFAPRDVVHTWRCISEEGGRFLLLITPGENFEQFGYKMAEAQVVPAAEASFAQICAIAGEHGITMLPPNWTSQDE